MLPIRYVPSLLPCFALAAAPAWAQWYELTGDRIEVELPMSLRRDAVAGSPELGSFAYGPLTLVACMGRDGLSRDMIDAG